MASSPTKATIKPIHPEIHPFKGSSPDDMVPQMAMPHMASKNISQDRNWSANERMMGMKALTAIFAQPTIPQLNFFFDFIWISPSRTKEKRDTILFLNNAISFFYIDQDKNSIVSRFSLSSR